MIDLRMEVMSFSATAHDRASLINSMDKFVRAHQAKMARLHSLLMRQKHAFSECHRAMGGRLWGLKYPLQ